MFDKHDWYTLDVHYDKGGAIVAVEYVGFMYDTSVKPVHRYLVGDRQTAYYSEYTVTYKGERCQAPRLWYRWEYASYKINGYWANVSIRYIYGGRKGRLVEQEVRYSYGNRSFTTIEKF